MSKYEKKYKVEASAFVETLRTRNMIISANSEEEAIEKAKERFDKEQYRLHRVTNVSTVEIDSVVRI